MNQTNQAIQMLADRGWVGGIVERRVSRTVCHDWLGLADIIAVPPISMNAFAAAIQVTDDSNVAARVKKMMSPENITNLRLLIDLDWFVEVWGIRKKEVKGSLVKCRMFTSTIRDGIVVVNRSGILSEN